MVSGKGDAARIAKAVTQAGAETLIAEANERRPLHF